MRDIVEHTFLRVTLCILNPMVYVTGNTYWCKPAIIKMISLDLNPSNVNCFFINIWYHDSLGSETSNSKSNVCGMKTSLRHVRFCITAS